MSPLSTEDQVQLITNILDSIGNDPTWQPQGGLSSVIPCGFAELGRWTSRMPDAGIQRVMEEAFSRMSFINSMASLNPDDLTGLGDIAADDPRVPGFIAQLSAHWPRPEQTAAITDLYECVARTIREMAAARPNLTKDTPAAVGLDSAAVTLGISVADIAKQLGSADDLLAQLAAFVPGEPSHSLRIAQVSAPQINFVFSASGSTATNDTVAPVVLIGTKGEGFLQSRSGPAGEAGTAGAGLTPCYYRVALSGLAGDAGASSLEIPMHVPATLDLAAAGVKGEAEVVVITQGGLGQVAPARAAAVGGRVILTFDPPVRAGQDSFFIGVAGAGEARPVTATIRDRLGNAVEVNSIATIMA